MNPEAKIPVKCRVVQPCVVLSDTLITLFFQVIVGGIFAPLSITTSAEMTASGCGSIVSMWLDTHEYFH